MSLLPKHTSPNAVHPDPMGLPTEAWSNRSNASSVSYSQKTDNMLSPLPTSIPHPPLLGTNSNRRHSIFTKTNSIRNFLDEKNNTDFKVPMTIWEKLSIVLSILSFLIMLMVTIWAASVNAKPEFVSNDPTVNSSTNKQIQDLNKASDVLSYIKLICNIATFSIVSISFMTRNTRVQETALGAQKRLKEATDKFRSKRNNKSSSSDNVQEM